MLQYFKVVALVGVTVAAFVAAGATAATLITGKQVKDSSLTGRDIKNRSLSPADFRGSIRGDEGPQGPAGPQGTPGPPGLANVTEVRSSDVYVPPGEVGSARADCPPGRRVVGTGAYPSIGNLGFVESFTSFVGVAVANDTSIGIDIHAQAICATVNTATLRASTVAERTFAARLAEFKEARLR